MFTHLLPETGIKPSLLDEVSHHLGMALCHCLVETTLSKVVQVKPAVSKFGNEVLDNLQVATKGSKVEGVHKVLNHISKHEKQYINYYRYTQLTMPHITHIQVAVPVHLHS